MKSQQCLIRLLSLGLAVLVCNSSLGASSKSGDEEPRGYVFVLSGAWHRQLVEYYINRLDEHLLPPLSDKQKTEIRALLNEEADKLEAIHLREFADLEYMMRNTVKLAHETHQKLYDILDEDQQYIIPYIVENRQEQLRNRLEIWMDSLWYEVEHPDED